MCKRISEADREKYVEKLSENIEVIEFINENFKSSYGKSLKKFLNPKTDYELNISKMLISYYSDICSLRGNARIKCDIKNNITLKAMLDTYNSVDNEYAKVAKNGYDMLDSDDDDSINKLASFCVDSIVLANHATGMEFYFYLSENSGIVVENYDDVFKLNSYVREISSTVTKFNTISVVDFFAEEPYEFNENDEKIVKLNKFIKAFHEYAMKYMPSKKENLEESQKIRK